ncbi:MAG: Cyclic di-GMP phosphodiesterase response regulator RpfG [Syntrophorhabdus sp. PtaB.Bin184]|jgi:response regulator RpfG family c-di-GMP phosphodiesterase|nr:MAG: Cyclic di-GMP phosphodiesterase response regulator RpfG [Syntrophorhabdus sp. PtaB.Bin184]
MIEGTKILVVDDNPEVINILGDFLGLNGCEIYKATCGREALEMLEKKDPEIVILDVQLPDLNGITLIDTIKVSKPTTAVIMATGYYDPNFVIDAMKKGASDFLLKPFELDKLMLVMMRVLRERKLLIENESMMQNLSDKKKIEHLNRELQKKIKELTTMYHISNRFNSINIFEDVYEKMVQIVGETLDIRSCGYYVPDGDTNELILYTGHTKNGEPPGWDWQRISIPEDLSDPTRRARKHVVKDNRIYLPLVIQGEPIGFIMTEAKMNGKGPRSLENDAFFLRLIAEKASTQIENRMLYESLFENILHTLKSLIIAITKRDLYTDGHCKRVTGMSLALAERVGVSDYEKDVIKVVCPVHDLGKIGIPDRILLKPERLSDEEYAVMQSHSVYGEEIMSRFEILAKEAKIIRHHHERYDGKGYPDRLAGSDIPMCSRIIAVCDAFDAMITDRPYRKAMGADEVVAEIARCSGSQFDPEIVKTFVDLVRDGYEW